MAVLLLLGPSGSGKSTLGGWIQEDLGYRHLEIDRFPDGDGIDLEHLRPEWDAFWNGAAARPLAAALNARAREARRRGVVLSFPSGVVPTPHHLAAAARAGIKVLVLYGTGAECMEAFLRREQESGRGLGADHWILNNAQAYAGLSGPDYAAHRVLAFEGGHFRNRPALIAEVRERAG